MRCKLLPYFWILMGEGVVPVTEPPRPVFITITFIRESSEGIHLRWRNFAFPKALLGTCTFHYGPGHNMNRYQLHFTPEKEELIVKKVEPRVLYQGYITCQNGRFILPSNTIQFSSNRCHNEEPFSPLTKVACDIHRDSSQENNFRSSESPLGGETRTMPSEKTSRAIENKRKILFPQKGSSKKFSDLPPTSPTVTSSIAKSLSHETSSTPFLFDRRIPKESAMFSRSISAVPKLGPVRHYGSVAATVQRNADEVNIVIMSQRHMNQARNDPHNSKPSTSVILGVICGLVGFIIINVTVVFVVRQYSLRRDRQRRLFELQLEQHGGFIFNIEDILNA